MLKSNQWFPCLTNNIQTPRLNLIFKGTVIQLSTRENFITTMNYLAHAYLSFGDPGILTGNMISDFVKGKRNLTTRTRSKKESLAPGHR